MKKLAILFLYLFFWRCNPQPEMIPVKLQPEELEVIKDTFPDAVCCYWQQAEYGFRSFEKESREEEDKRFKKWADSIYKNQSSKIIWFVNDTLYNPMDLSLVKEHHIDKRIKLDSSYLKLENSLFSRNYEKKAIKLSGLNIGKYFFESFTLAKKYNKISKRYIALSRVVFNPNHTKACYYVSQSLPSKYWGAGEIMYVEKKQGKWVLIYRRIYWIA